MTPNAPPPRPSLQTLPLEAITDILRGVDDWESLQAAILSCRALYDAYHHGNGMATPLLEMISCDEIMTVILEHLAAQRSIDYDDIERLNDFAHIVDLVASRWNGEDVAMMCDKRRLMLRTRDEFFADISSRLRWLSGVQAPLSNCEKNRFNTAFLLYMTIENTVYLDHKQARKSLSALHLNFDIDCPWVNEQINCLYDYFHDKATRGHFTTDTLLQVTEGVEFINHLEDAETNDEKISFLSSWIPDSPPLLQTFLTRTSLDLCPPGEDKAIVSYDNSEQRQFQDMLGRDKTCVCGCPLDTWLATHLFKKYVKGSLGFSFRPETKCLRRVGYVMWDRQRMADEKLQGQFEKIYGEESPEYYAEEPGKSSPWETRVNIVFMDVD